MSRRGGPGLQILIGVAVVGLFLYGFYSYHEIQSRLRKMEEKADRLKVQHESVSAQLQVVYEHKTRLEKAVQEEKSQHRKTKDDLTNEKQTLEEKMNQETKTLTEELDRIKGEHEKLEENFNRVDGDKQQIQDEMRRLQDTCQRERESSLQQVNQQRQECDNDVAQLKDEIANLGRRNAELEVKVQNETRQKVGDTAAGANGRNKSLGNEDQHVMQIAEPDANKPKAYFEVKSPAPEDRNFANIKQLPQQGKEQVAPPNVNDNDANGPAVNVAKQNADTGAAGVHEGEVPNRYENQIKDATEKTTRGSLDGGRLPNDNVINRVPGEPGDRKEEENPVPVQVPVPAAKEQDGVAARPDSNQNKLSEMVKPGLEGPPGQVVQPGQEVHPVQPDAQLLKPGHGAVEPVDPGVPDEDEDEDAEDDQQAHIEEQQQNPDAKKNPENEQDEYGDNRGIARDM